MTTLPKEYEQRIEHEAQAWTNHLKENNDYQMGYSQGCRDGYEQGAILYATHSSLLMRLLLTQTN